MKEELLQKYAKLAVCTGVNIQPGQLLVINASVKDYKFVEMCVKEAYLAKASEVHVNWNDENISKLSYQYCDIDTLTDIPQFAYDMRKWAQDKGAAFLNISSNTPGLLKDIDPAKLKASALASRKKFADLQDYTMANKGQWSIVALPSEGWAKRVFPELESEEAVNKLAEAILKSVRIDETNDPVQEWKNHNKKLSEHCALLNDYHFKTLHFENSLGTNLNVGLVDKHLWAGGSCDTQSGVEFNPNMPTEEAFSMPHKDRVDGTVVSTKPLSYGGKVIEQFTLKFENGKVVEYSATNDEETLKDLLETDEGSKHLGEVALISYHSPISLMNILFYNTLFDENASCHLALGACYPENIENGVNLTREEIGANGGNDSMNHVDFMFGSSDMKVIGIKEDGSEVTVFENGDFVI